MTFEEALGNLIEKYGADEFPWEFIPLSQACNSFIKALQAELSESHPLHDRNIRWAIAKSGAADDVLFLGEDGVYFIVHLTYSKTNSLGSPHFFEFPDLNAAIKHIEEQFLLSQ